MSSVVYTERTPPKEDPMSQLICPECGEPAEQGRPRGGSGGWALPADPRRLNHRHAADREPLCPVMTSQGYQPAMPRRG